MVIPHYRAGSHALLTRSPLASTLPKECLLPFDLHVLGLPPAFVLSQDQTLRFETFGSYHALPFGTPLAECGMRTVAARLTGGLKSAAFASRLAASACAHISWPSETRASASGFPQDTAACVSLSFPYDVKEPFETGLGDRLAAAFLPRPCERSCI